MSPNTGLSILATGLKHWSLIRLGGLGNTPPRATEIFEGVGYSLAAPPPDAPPEAATAARGAGMRMGASLAPSLGVIIGLAAVYAAVRWSQSNHDSANATALWAMLAAFSPIGWGLFVAGRAAYRAFKS